MRILVTGASGLLGLNFCLWAAQHHEVIGIVHSHTLSHVPFKLRRADLSNEKLARNIIAEEQPNLVVHCAAMANLDQCERMPEAAKIINADLPSWLAEECAVRNVQFLHISTDSVFDGYKKGAYTEADIPNPLCVYARTKFEGEKAVQENNPKALIVRVNFYGLSLSGKRSLAEFFLYNLLAGKHVKGFTDVHFCPLYVKDLSVILIKMISKELKGLYHVVSSESLSKYDFGVRLARYFNLDTSLIIPTSVNKSGLIAHRSSNLVLCIDKLKNALGEMIPAQEQGLHHFYNSYKEGYATRLKKYLV